MTSFKIALVAATALMLPATANAALVGQTGGGAGPFLNLSQAGLNGGAVATLSGGTVYNQDLPFADIPEGNVFGNNFLAAGPQAGEPATLSFTAPVNYLSFLWGSPDTYNVLTLTTNVASYAFSAESLGFAVTDGNQAFSQYVQFTASAGELINSVSFSNTPQIDAFESANFSVTAVPEPGTWAMMMVGFGMVAGAARYRRRSTKAVFA